MSNQIEGVVKEGESVIVIEDLVSTGGSSLNAVKALRDAGASVLGMYAIFTYGLPVALNNFKQSECLLSTLTDFDALVQKAVSQSYITQQELQSLLEWRQDPAAWKV